MDFYQGLEFREEVLEISLYRLYNMGGLDSWNRGFPFKDPTLWGTILMREILFCECLRVSGLTGYGLGLRSQRVGVFFGRPTS